MHLSLDSEGQGSAMGPAVSTALPWPPHSPREAWWNLIGPEHWNIEMVATLTPFSCHLQRRGSLSDFI